MNAFLNPAWLWGFAAVAIPVVLHLFFRRRFTVVRWAAMRFLAQAVQKSSRRQKLTQILLMAARMLVLALLAAAFARPYLADASGVAATLAPRHYCLVLDRSLSMAYRAGEGGEGREGGSTLWESARARAAAWIRTLSGADRLLVVATPQGGAARSLSFTGDMERAAAEVEEMALSDGPADIVSALLAGCAAAAEAAVPDLQFVVVTDLQRVSFREDAKAAWKEFARRAGSSAAVTVVVLGPERPMDAGIVRLELVGGLAGVNQPARVRATVVRSGAAGRTEPVPVTFWVDGVKKESRLVDPPAGGTASCEATVVFGSEGHHVVTATLPADALEEDNRAHAVARARAAIRVLCVHDPAVPSDLARATSLLEFALAPAPGMTPFVPEPAAAGELAARAEEADAFILADLPRLEAREIAALESAVRRGRGVAFLPGAAADAAAWNDALHRDGSGLLPARLERVEEPPDARNPFRLAAGSGSHPFTEPFSAARGDWARTAVWKRWAIGGDAAFRRTLMAFEDGAPALLERSFGRGTAVLWTGGISAGWTNLAARPLFVPWTHQLARTLVGRQAERANRLWGESSRWELPVAAVGKKADLVSPDGRRLALAPVQEEGIWELPLGPFDRAGLWSLQIEGEPETPISVGYPREELDLARIARPEVSALAGNVPVSFGADWGAPAAGAKGADLSRALLFVLLALFYVESWLAWRAGHIVRERSPA